MDCTCTSLVSELLWMFKWYCDKTRQHWTSLYVRAQVEVSMAGWMTEETRALLVL